jgi:hypothetical protein
VPSAIELGSIVDYDFLNASIDAKAFPDTPIDTHSGVPLGYFGTTDGCPSLRSPVGWWTSTREQSA